MSKANYPKNIKYLNDLLLKESWELSNSYTNVDYMYQILL